MWRNSLNGHWFSLFYCPFLAWHFVNFHARHDNPCPILSSMPSMTFFLSLSLYLFFTMPGMKIPCEPQSPSLSENETRDISARLYSWAWSTFFHISVAFISVDELVRYLVNKPLPAAGLSADNVRGWEIVRKMNIWPRSEASRANVKFWGQSLSQGHYKPIDQQAGKGFIYFITLPLIFFAIKPRVNMAKKPVVIWWRMRAWLTWGSKSKFDWFN